MRASHHRYLQGQPLIIVHFLAPCSHDNPITLPVTIMVSSFGMWWPDCQLLRTLKGFNQSSHSLLQVTGLRVQRRTWTTLHLPTTMATGLPSSPRRAWAWKHTSAFWTCGGLVPTVALRKQIWARLWFWLNDCIWSQRDWQRDSAVAV